MQSVSVSREMILEGYKLACRTWQKKIEELFPSALGKTTKMLKIGNIIKLIGTSLDPNEQYIVTRSGRYNGREETIMLVSLKDGNLWNDGIPKDLEYSSKGISSRVLVSNYDVEVIKGDIEEVPTQDFFDVDVQFVKDAYKACPNDKFKQKIKATYPDVFENPTDKIAVERGDRIEVTHKKVTIQDIYMVAQVQDNGFALVSLTAGNRFSNVRNILQNERKFGEKMALSQLLDENHIDDYEFRLLEKNS